MDTQTKERPLQSLGETEAQNIIRAGAIDRRQQAGNLSHDDEQEIRAGKQDQSLGFDDAVYALTNADQLWDKSQQMGKQES